MDQDFTAVFFEEAAELIEELEDALLALETSPDDMSIVGRVFRAMHTIKGSGAMFGFDDIAGFTHHVETVLDKVREGKLAVTGELISLTLASRDHIKNMLAAARGEGEADTAVGDGIIAAMQRLVSGETGERARDEGAAPGRSATAVVANPQREEVDSTDHYVHYHLRIRLLENFFEQGGDMIEILNNLMRLGDMTVFHHDDIDDIDDGDATAKGQKAIQYWDILVTTRKGYNAIKDVFIFVEEICEYNLKNLTIGGDEAFPPHKRLGEILLERGDISSEELENTLARQRPLGELLVESKSVSAEKVASALAEQKAFRQALDNQKRIAGQAAAGVSDSIRVGADKLDQLVNLVGELVVTQARLTQMAATYHDTALVEPVEEVERLTGELRDVVLNIRMLPIGTTFARFKRLVRDLSGEMGKEVEMVTEGADTELDKSVIEKLGDPLVHLIRNSIDHGLETPEERGAAGKQAKGIIKLAAAHSGANVVITVSDDGRGLHRDKIRKKAVEKGLVAMDAELTDSEIYSLIFKAGFSTSEKVSSVSGRGVGMDVVRTTIETLKGSVTIESEEGSGTIITVTLPLTLAIIDGLLVFVGGTHFVLPQALVEECVELSQEDIDRFHGRRVYAMRGALVPYIRLRDYFRIGGGRPELEQMVIVNVNGERIGMVLDYVIGNHQTVLKSLGWVYRKAEGISGATILGNGEVALIIDVRDLARFAQKDEAEVKQ